MCDTNVLARLGTLCDSGKIAILIARGTTVLAIVALADTVKDGAVCVALGDGADALSTIITLQNMGMQVIMLTGDHRCVDDMYAICGCGQIYVRFYICMF